MRMRSYCFSGKKKDAIFTHPYLILEGSHILERFIGHNFVRSEKAIAQYITAALRCKKDGSSQVSS